MMSRHSTDNRENESAGQPQERTKRQERAERILEAASALITRWGFNKTTMDDIARQAGVAKGTLYLHWKTKDALFRSLYYHESVKLASDIEQRIAADPAGMSLPALIKHSMLAVMKNPLMKAVLIHDSEMIGEFAHREYGDALNQQRIAMYKALFETLRAQGQLRADLSVSDLIYVWSAVSWGFLAIDPYLPEEFRVSDERAADLLADAIQRTIEPREPVSEGKAKETARTLNDYYNELSDIVREQDKQGIEP